MKIIMPIALLIAFALIPTINADQNITNAHQNTTTEMFSATDHLDHSNNDKESTQEKAPITQDNLRQKVLDDMENAYKAVTRDYPSSHLWFDDNGSLTPCGEEALEFIKLAASHGLETKGFEHILHIDSGTPREQAEHHMTKAVLHFIEEITGGKARDDFAAKHPSLTKKINAEKILSESILSEKNCKNLWKFLPEAPQYKALQKGLIHYQNYVQKAKQIGDPAFTFSGKIKKGDKGKNVLAIKKYLIFYDYLDEKESATDLYDSVLEEAIKLFQTHHCEEADGVIGEKTAHLFKRTAENRLNLIRLNLRRWRYLPAPLPERYILVNVAGYRVDVVENNTIALSMKAVVGMPSRKTPLFEAPMTHFIFNPTWTVPNGIFYKDKLPRILNDPSYLERVGAFMRGHDGLPVNVDDIDWHDPSQRPRITYPPGKSNPLGQIKFQIDNKFTIYLHDTNQKKLLQNSKRAKSSGCIRLEKPRELVAWLQRGQKYGTVDAVNEALEKSRATSWHAIKSPVQVYFVYFTVWGDEGSGEDGHDGKLFFSDDPYNYDPKNA